MRYLLLFSDYAYGMIYSAVEPSVEYFSAMLCSAAVS
jgi:hypothetical protein